MTPSASTTRPPPLAGRRVLDLSRVLAGPWCGQVLADLGAEVIKVEAPGAGDDTRHWGPPYAGGESAYYLSANRGKKSIAIDLSNPAGQEIVRALAAKSDVLLENFKLGGLDKYGLGYADIARINARIVYCSISGYGRASPIAERPGYDYVIQAEGGLMAITGEPDGAPVKVGVAVADLFTGMSAAQAVLAALIAVDRDGVGQHLDLALYDCQIAMLANVASAYLLSGEEAPRFGNGHQTIVPYQVFRTRDAAMVVAVGNNRQFVALCNVLSLPDLARDPRFVTNPARVANRPALIELLQAQFLQQATEFWLPALRAAGIPCGEVRSVGAALNADETLARGMVVRTPHPTIGEVGLTASPLKMSGTPVAPPVAPPLLGQHTDAVLQELLGRSADDVAALRASGAVA